MAIFSHVDGSDDSMEILEHTPHNQLRMWARGDDGDCVNVVIPRSKVLSLIQALTEWAYPTHTPEGPNRSLIEELIAKAAKDAVSAVLPLHLSSFATQMQAAEDKIERVANALLSDPEPEPGDVGHPRPPLPVRQKTVITPECGLCKQPWSDGHGQPGDPCPGVEAARQHPSDWTDALWRVKPEPTGELSDEKTYCGACGHSWVTHWESIGRCTSTVGKGKCECPRRPA